RRRQVDLRAAPRAPAARDGYEDGRLGPNPASLLLGRQLDHAPALVRVAERREDLPPHTEIRMAHVRRLGRLGQAERQAAESVSGHDPPPFSCRPGQTVAAPPGPGGASRRRGPPSVSSFVRKKGGVDTALDGHKPQAYKVFRPNRPCPAQKSRTR